MLEKTKPLQEVLEDFTGWLNYHGGKDWYLWGRSPRFDEGKLQDAFDVLKMEVPWDFRKEMDVRTLMELVPGTWETTTVEGDPHDPIVDAYKQIEAVRRAYHLLSLRPISLKS